MQEQLSIIIYVKVESHCDTFGFEIPEGCRLTYKSKWQFWYPVFAILSVNGNFSPVFCHFAFQTS